MSGVRLRSPVRLRHAVGCGVARADRWEDVPLYVRLRVRVACSDRESVDAWVYVRSDVEGEPVPADARDVASVDRATILRLLEESDMLD